MTARQHQNLHRRTAAGYRGIEHTGIYKGTYHVLHGASRHEGVGSNDIRIRELLNRLQNNNVTEVILATNTNWKVSRQHYIYNV